MSTAFLLGLGGFLLVFLALVVIGLKATEHCTGTEEDDDPRGGYC